MQNKKSKKYIKKVDRGDTLQDLTVNAEILEVWPELSEHNGIASQRTAVWRVEKSALRKMREILTEAGISTEDINGKDA